MTGLSFSTSHLAGRRKDHATARRKADWLVGDAPADTDEVPAGLKAPPGWIRLLVVAAATAGLWLLIAIVVAAVFAYGR